MNKTLTTALAISALAVNVVGATSNNTVGGTDNTISPQRLQAPQYGASKTTSMLIMRWRSVLTIP